MQANGVCQRDGDAHPMPGVFLVIRGLVPVRHQHKRLDQDQAVGFVVKIIEELQTDGGVSM